MPKIFELSNLQFLIDLDQKFFADKLQSWDGNFWKKIARDDQFLIYYIRDSIEFISFAIVQKTEQWHLLKMVTDEKWQKKGFALQLLETIITDAKLQKMSIFLEVEDKNFAAIQLYSKLNFKTLTKVVKYYSNGSDCLKMLRS